MDKNDYLVGHMFHLMGHASDFVELEEVPDKDKALMGCPIEFSQPGQWNRRGYWEREKKLSAGWDPQTSVHVGDGLLDHYLGSSGTPGTRVKVKLVQILGNLRVPWKQEQLFREQCPILDGFFQWKFKIINDGENSSQPKN